MTKLCDKVVSERVVCDKVGVTKLYVTKLCVKGCDSRRRGGGGGGGKRDTELKTRTPHNDVGNNHHGSNNIFHNHLPSKHDKVKRDTHI